VILFSSIVLAVNSGYQIMDNVGFADLKKSLECPICLEMLVTPVVNCTLGHIICSLCRPKVDKCGLCGSRFMNGSRNYPIETILGMMEVSCRHTGCPLVMKADKLNEHLSVCDFRSALLFTVCWMNFHCSLNRTKQSLVVV